MIYHPIKCNVNHASGRDALLWAQSAATRIEGGNMTCLVAPSIQSNGSGTREVMRLSIARAAELATVEAEKATVQVEEATVQAESAVAVLEEKIRAAHATANRVREYNSREVAVLQEKVRAANRRVAVSEGMLAELRARPIKWALSQKLHTIKWALSQKLHTSG
eukprot:6144658-Prymnesium_polylepis.1